MPNDADRTLDIFERIGRRDYGGSVKEYFSEMLPNVQSGIKKTLADADPAVNYMFERRLHHPHECKGEWTPTLPLAIHTKEYPMLDDGRTPGFTTYAYKDRLLIEAMSPEEYLSLVADGTDMLRNYEREAAEGPAGPLFADSTEQPEHSKFFKSIENLKEKMKACKAIDTPFMDVSLDKCRVYNHEGRHRAIAAKAAGIEKIPVWVMTDDSMNSHDVQKCFRPSRRILPEKRR